MGDADGIQLYMLALANKDNHPLYEKYLRASSDNGYIPAKLALAELYRENDIAKAIGLYKDLANGGMNYAMFRLGECYLADNDHKEGFKWLSMSASSGNIDAMYLLHSLSHDDTEDMNRWFSEYAERLDYTDAWRIMNIMDDDNAESSWKRMVELSSDNPQRMINEIDACIELYLKNDPHGRFVWHMRCSQLNDSDSMLEVGRMYQLGLGVDRSYDHAMEYYRKAAELDNYRAMYRIGRMYQLGLGVEASNNDARQWFQKIPSIDYPMAEYRIAELNGIDDIFDELGTDFVDLLELFAKGNDAESQFFLGRFYHWLFSYDDMGSGNIDKRAMRFYTKAAQNGYPEAQTFLGTLYETGSGNLKQSYEKALEWYLKASDNGDAEGSYRAALLLKNGKGTDVSIGKAKELFLKASESNELKDRCASELESLHQ